MAAAGARAQKPVGSAAWISTEKENCAQLVAQEMEEIEFPARYEMEWLNEHMAEVFSNNQLNFADVFKTPGKLRGKTPRTLRKRDPTENRVPLSEIFSSVQKNRPDPTFSTSPVAQRSPTKAITAPPAPTPPVVTQGAPAPSASAQTAATPAKATTSSDKAKNRAPTPTEPQYPDLTQDINSFSQYNTDSGYHGMPDDDDEVVLTQVAPESQSTQQLDPEPTSFREARRSSVDRRTTDASFHSAPEEVRHRGGTAEPMNLDSPKQTRKEYAPVPEPSKEAESEADEVMEDKPDNRGAVTAPNARNVSGQDAESTPVKTTIPQPSSPQEPNEPEKDEMVLDDLDDIGSPSEKDSPERPPIRKSSLSFASLPAREPLAPKSIGSSRLSRTSHLESIKSNTASNYLGRQTGHRLTQADRMDVDDPKETAHVEADEDVKASKLHNKSSTQRLHEKISMLGKMQPSRPTKSIPAVAGLSSGPVSYPELPAVQPETKHETSNKKQREATPPQSPDAEDDWMKPMSSPFQAQPSAKSTVSKLKTTDPATSDATEEHSSPIKSRIAQEAAKMNARQTSDLARGKSTTPIFSSPQRFGHTKSASVNIDAKMTTTPIGSPRQDGPLSASKSRLQSIVRSAKGLFTSAAGISAAARMETSSPDEPRTQLQRADTDKTSQRPLSVFSPPRQEGRRTRSSTEREEKRRQQELEERKQEEELAEKARQQEKLRMTQQKATRERAHTESEARAPAVPSSPSRMLQQKSSREPEPAVDVAPKATQANRPNDRRPPKATRESQQKPKPQPVSVRVGSALSRQMPLASSVASSAESSIPVPPPSASKVPSLKKKASNQSLHTASSNSSFKSSVSSQTQRKAQLASERKREQEEREARRKEEQRREMERKRAAQQSRAEAERRERQVEDPKKAAQMQAIEKRRLENARRLERQGSQQPEMAPTYAEKTGTQTSHRETGAPRPASRLGSVLGRTINPPAPNPAKPPKRGMEEENHRSAAAKPGAMQPSGETKRRRTDDEQNRASMRPTMAPPIRQSNIRKEPAKKPSMYGTAQHSAAPQSGSTIFKTGQPQRPGHPMDMAKYASGKIPFAEPSNAGPSQSHRTPGPSSSKASKPSPNYPDGEKIQLPEIATDSEDEDSEAEMLPVPSWAQPKQLETLLRDQEGMEVDSIFGPIAPFSLEETFKADKRIKKFRERTSSANWAGPDGLTQEEIRRDVAERQRLRLNGGWTFGM
ncbi:uncharacterized protein ANIA_05403 [Aspergillus nidulans FGSC A4]|uniref:Inner centromere protein ARK-binding domain-containing protein n=1 Tax=Emericella nidulans (strain FGSC A4 / ATCC 38163 / CBS 112.46 / NRRL 194 / M139) TaxID=227321 RepID=C8VGM0_EMENI|nr:hypothetical protein [Aspergillus nidulans FGSC A4]CBF81966.1 TPA: conserved hypothetical protein [Aspergillus nidulans FGSC A4]